MNYDVAVTEIQQIVGWRSDKAAEIGNALKYAQAQREMAGMTFPWFLRQTKPVTTVIGTQSYTLPAGYIQDSEERDGNLFIYTGGTSKTRTVFLKKMSFKDLQEKFFGVWPDNDSATASDQSDTIPSGIPTFYALDDTQVFFYPTPDAVYTVNWKAWYADTAPTAGQTNQWLTFAPWVLIGEAATKIAADLENASAVTKAQAILSRANDDLFRATIHRQEAGRKRSMGSKL